MLQWGTGRPRGRRRARRSGRFTGVDAAPEVDRRHRRRAFRVRLAQTAQAAEDRRLCPQERAELGEQAAAIEVGQVALARGRMQVVDSAEPEDVACAAVKCLVLDDGAVGE